MSPAEKLAYHALKFPETRWAVLAPTQRILDDICFPDVIEALGPPANFEQRIRSEITLANGSKITGVSAQTPNRLRGPLFHGSMRYYGPGQMTTAEMTSHDYLDFGSMLLLPGVLHEAQNPVFS